MDAVVYIHTSLHSRWEQSREQEASRAFLEAQPDLRLIRTYADFGPCREPRSRRGLLSLLQGAEAGRFQVLAVRAPRILAPEPAEILEIYSYLAHRNIRVLFYDGKQYPMDYWARQYQRMRKDLVS